MGNDTEKKMKVVEPAVEPVGCRDLFGPVMTVPDSSGWWWYRHAHDLNPVCVEVTITIHTNGSITGRVQYGRSGYSLSAWMDYRENNEWIKAANPWPNNPAQGPAAMDKP